MFKMTADSHDLFPYGQDPVKKMQLDIVKGNFTCVYGAMLHPQICLSGSRDLKTNPQSCSSASLELLEDGTKRFLNGHLGLLDSGQITPVQLQLDLVLLLGLCRCVGVRSDRDLR